MRNHLHKEPHGVYYFRMAIPASLRPHFGKREFKHSLRTKNKDEAEFLVLDHIKEARRLLRRAREQADPVPACHPPSPVSPARAARLRALEDYDREQAELADLMDAERCRLEMERKEREPLVSALEQRLRDPNADLSPAELAARDLVADLRLEAETAGEQLAIARMARYEPVTADGLASHENKTDTSPADMLTPGIFERWKAEGVKRPKTIEMFAKTAAWFQARIGDVAVQDITKGHVIAFKDKLIAEGHSIANINVRLSHISALLGWAARNDIVPINVAKNTQIPNPQAKKNRRKPFDLADLNAIFDGPVHSKGERPVQGKGEAAYWLPVLALYTGARVRELAQLRRGDVQEKQYPDADAKLRTGWFLAITEDTDEAGLANAIKNDASERLVPVHPKLIELGFIDYVQALENQRGRIFPSLPEDKFGNPAAKWGEWFSRYLRGTCGVTDKRKTFHSFRHAFKDNARNSGIDSDMQRQLMGHEGGDVADQYGAGYANYSMVEAMEKYRVPGLEISPPS